WSACLPLSPAGSHGRQNYIHRKSPSSSPAPGPETSAHVILRFPVPYKKALPIMVCVPLYERAFSFILQVTVQFLCFFFFYGLLYIQDFHLDSLAAELDFQNITGLYLCRRLRRTVVDQNTSCVACLIGYRAALDQPGNL